MSSLATLHLHQGPPESYRPFWDWLARVKPKFIKTLDAGIAPAIKAISPNTQVIYRRFAPGHPLLEEDYLAYVRGVLRASNQYVDYIEGDNEPPGQSNWDANGQWLVNERKAIELAASQGKKYIALNASTGTIPVDWWWNEARKNEFRKLFEVLAQHKGIYGRHEYDAPRAWTLHNYGLAKPKDQWQDSSPYKQGDGGCWLTLRFRRELYIMRNILGWPESIIPYVLPTEALIDGGVTHPARGGGNPGGGWRDFVSFAEFTKDMEWYETEARKEPKFLAYCLFGYESVDPTWHSWSIGSTPTPRYNVGYEKELADWQMAFNPAPIPPPTPSPTPVPTPTAWSNVPPRIAQWKNLILAERRKPLPGGAPQYPEYILYGDGKAATSWLTATMIDKESAGNPNAVGPAVIIAGREHHAYGLLQVLDLPGRPPASELLKPEVNIREGIKILYSNIQSTDLWRGVKNYSGGWAVSGWINFWELYGRSLYYNYKTWFNESMPLPIVK